MADLNRYRAADAPIPERMYKWFFYGEGIDSLEVREVPVPTYGADELLVRQDAVGLCFSDTKVIALGKDHPRMVGRDLRTQPVTLGHEVACTVVGVGERRKDRFKVGERFIIQADVFYKGVSMAYGYVISGGLAEYSVIPKEMIDGDEGCYLLPMRPTAGYAETALVEPWACVVSAYHQGHRSGVKPKGFLLVLAGSDAVRADWDGLFDATPDRPTTAVVVGNQSAATRLGDALHDRSSVSRLDSVSDWAELKAQYTGDAGFDDIVVLGGVAPEEIEGAATTLANHAILALVGPAQIERKLSLDIGRVHYNWHHYVGTPTWQVAQAYVEPRGAELRPGGAAWFIGAGGPMGQMHVQLAVQHPNPPKRIVATDIDSGRLQSVVDRLGSIAASRGIELIAINPKEMAPDAFDAELRRLTDGRGFDDIVSLVPVPALIEHAIGFLADGAWCNIFAGVARGTMAQLDANAIRARGVRYIGSSGSSIADMRETLQMVETGALSTNTSLAAIGGMKAARDGMRAVKEGRFPGKSLVYPLIPDLPLTALPDLKGIYPTVYARMKDGKFWTNEAEEELLRIALPER
jgi:threonine dehydrogenase-like Zn-dependent dehydrogenase